MARKQKKREIEVEGCVIHFLLYWSLLYLSTVLSSQQAAVNLAVFFHFDWRLPSVRNDIFCILAFSLTTTQFLERVLHPSWLLTSVELNNRQRAMTTLSTTNKDRTIIARTRKSSPSMKSCLEEFFHVSKRKCCVAEEATAVLSLFIYFALLLRTCMQNV